MASRARALRKTPRSIAEDSEKLVLSLLDRLQHDLSCEARPIKQVLNEIRQIILNQQELIRACVGAVRDVVDSRQIHVDLEVWSDFFELAPKRQNLPDRGRSRKLRALASLTAIWGAEVIKHYKWESKDARHLERLRCCALAYPDFETFSKIANVVMLRRHEHSLSNARTLSIGYTPRGPRDPSPLTLQDLEVLVHFATKRDEADVHYGRCLTTQSFNDEEELKRVEKWSNCSDGAVIIGDRPLRSLKPQHYDQYLLQRDVFGMFAPSEPGNTASVGGSKKRSSDDMSPLRTKSQRTSVGRPSFPNLGTRERTLERLSVTTTSSSRQLSVELDTDTISTQGASTSPCSLIQAGSPEVATQFDNSAMASEVQTATPASTPSANEIQTSINASPSPDNSVHGDERRPVASSPVSCERPEAAQASANLFDQSTDREFSQTPGCDTATSAGLRTAASPSVPVLFEENPAGPVQDGQPSPEGHRVQCAVRGAQEPMQVNSPAKEGHDSVTTKPAIQTVPPGLDCLFRGDPNWVIFPPGLSEADRNELQRWSDVAYKIEEQVPHATLKHWLHPIRHARIHKVADPGAPASVEVDGFDVLDLNWSDFKARASSGDIFSTPLLIREAFDDAGEFSSDKYAETLEQTFPGMKLDVRYHQSQPEPIPISEAARLVRTSPGTVLANAPNFLDLDSVSNAIKPALTRIPRFRLLDRLVRGAKANYSGRAGKKLFLTPFDVGSCQSFEILGLPGAFSGAHMDALGGTWLRNLFGTKLWMIVPQDLMSDQDWVEFGEEGPGWNPGTKSRAIILRTGDVFFMPPGIRVIHAVLTLETCLMDGGMLWDDVTLLPLLRTIHWIGQNQNATNEALPYQLGEILGQLEKVLSNGEAKSRFGDVAAIASTVQDLRSLGCACQTCDEECSCLRCRRRCTPLCCDHAMETEKHCFEEAYVEAAFAEDSDDGFSLFGDS